MWLMEFLYTVLCIVMILNVLSMIFEFRSGKSLPQVENKKIMWTWREALQSSIVIASLVLTVILSLFLTINLRIKIVLNFIIFLVWIKYATNAFISSKNLWGIINEKSADKLSKGERSAILWIAIFVLYFLNCDFIDQIYLSMKTYPNKICSDWMMICFYILIISVFIFLISALAISPLKFFVRLLYKFLSHIRRQKSNYMIDCLKRYISTRFKGKLLSESIIEQRTKHKTIIQRLLIVIIIALAFIIDLLCCVIICVTSIVVMIIWYLFLTFYGVGCILNKIGSWILELSDRNTVALSFRLSIIVGLGATVVINRYVPFVHNQEETTAILEFISSVIIIPLVFEWISSYQKEIKSIKFLECE